MAVMAVFVAVTVVAVVVVGTVAVAVAGPVVAVTVVFVAVAVTVVTVVVQHDDVVFVVVVGVVSEQPGPERLPQPLGGEHLVGRARGHQPVGQEHHRVAVPGLVQVVGGDDHDGAPARVVLDHVEDPLLAGDVEASNGFVQHEDIGLAR